MEQRKQPGRAGRGGRSRYVALPIKRMVLTVWLIGAFLAAAAAVAQDAPSSTHTEIVEQVRFTREQFVELTAKMLEVADLLEESEPDSALVLREAVSQARRAFIAEDMERVASLLTEGLISVAASNQEGVIEELRKVLELLQGGVLDLEGRQERIQRWQEQLDRILRILQEQQRLEQQSRVRANQSEIETRFNELNEQIRSLVQRQQQLRDETAAQDEEALSEAVASVAELLEELRGLKASQEAIAEAMGTIGIDRLPLLGELQRQLGEQTSELADRVGELADDEQFGEEIEQLQGDPAAMGRAAENISSAATSMDQAAAELEEPNSQRARDRADDAVADLAEAEQALAGLLEQAAANSPTGELAGRQAELGRETEGLADALNELSDATGHPADPERVDAAGREMAGATEDLQAQQRDDALDHQDEAIRQLEEELYSLAQLQQRIREQEQRELPEQGAEQEDLADRTHRTAEDMQGQEGSEQTPGAEPMGQAAGSMDRAADALNGQSSSGSESQRASQANREQREAIENLERAAEDLADEIAQEQEQIEAEQLAKIDELLQKALDGQRQISEATVRAYASRDEDTGEYDRPEQLKLAELAQGEGQLGRDINDIRDMLDEDGSTVVFPVVLKQVQDDLAQAARRLESLNADEMTQGIQEDIELALEEMIAAIREELSERRNRPSAPPGGPPGGGGSPGDSPLVPLMAELKMLRRLQLQITKQTRLLNSQLGTLPAEEADEQHIRLAERQKQLQEMTAALAERVEQQQLLPEQEGSEP